MRKILLLLMCVVVAQLEAVVSNGSLDTSFNPTPPHTFPGVPGAEVIFSLTQNFGAGTVVAEALSLAIQSNGNIVAAGFSQQSPANPTGLTMAIVSLNASNGSLDGAFNSGGVFPGTPGVESIWTASFGSGATSAESLAIAIQSDGKIVLGGTANPNASNGDWSIVRLNSDGTLDSSFNALPSQFPGVPGIESIPPAYFQDDGSTGMLVTSLALQTDGKIVLVGIAESNLSPQGDTGSSFGIGRLTTTGGLDPGFNANHAFPGLQGVEVIFTASFGAGASRASPSAVAIQADGKIVVAGDVVISGATFMAIIRTTTAGGLDTSFNASGFRPGILVIPQNTFGTSTSSAAGSSIALQSDGKILIGGIVDTPAAGGFSMAVVRLNTDGTIDTTFNSGGTPGAFVIPLSDFGGSIGATSAETNGIKVQSGGSIVLAGDVTGSAGITTAVARFTNAGTLDPSFNPGGTLFPGVSGVETFPLSTFGPTSASSQANAVAIDFSNNIVLAGQASAQSQISFAFARLIANDVSVSGLSSPIAAAIIAKYC